MFTHGFDSPTPLYTMCKNSSNLAEDGFPKARLKRNVWRHFIFHWLWLAMPMKESWTHDIPEYEELSMLAHYGSGRGADLAHMHMILTEWSGNQCWISISGVCTLQSSQRTPLEWVLAKWRYREHVCFHQRVIPGWIVCVKRRLSGTFWMSAAPMCLSHIWSQSKHACFQQSLLWFALHCICHEETVKDGLLPIRVVFNQ